ncbi:kinase-like domain-containing protein [Mycena sanguinolenta]|nr:kinase-like domain-containing protein [Mycena sanguinolenta]
MLVVSLVRKLAEGAKRRLKALKGPRQAPSHGGDSSDHVVDSAVDLTPDKNQPVDNINPIPGISGPSLRGSAAACHAPPQSVTRRANLEGTIPQSGTPNSNPFAVYFSNQSRERGHCVERNYTHCVERNYTVNEPNALPSSTHEPALPSPPCIPNMVPIMLGPIRSPSPPHNHEAHSNQVQEGTSVNERDAFMTCMKSRLDPDLQTSNVTPRITRQLQPNDDERRPGDSAPRAFFNNNPNDPIITNTRRTTGMPPIGSPPSNASTERSNPVGSPWTPTTMMDFARQNHIVFDAMPQQQLEDFLSVPQLAADMRRLGHHVVESEPRTLDDLPQKMTIECANSAGNAVYNCVASGAFGRVFRCELPYPCRGGTLAVKVRIRPVDPSQNIDGYNLEWLTERRILNRLAANRPHPNLVSGYQFDFWAQGVGLTIFDYYPVTLSGMKPVQGPDNLKTRLYAAVTGEIAAGLNYLHSLDIIHKDMKPANILISWTGHCLITDYGACEMKDATNSAYDRLQKCIVQLPGGSVFTPGFTAPETMLAGLGGYATYTESSDFWSLGVTIYKLVINHERFSPADVTESQSANNFPITHAELNLDGGCRMAERMRYHGCPDEVSGLILKLCQLDAKNRIPGARVEPLTQQLVSRAGGVRGRDAPFAVWHSDSSVPRMGWNIYY